MLAHAGTKLTEEGVFHLLETFVKVNNLSLREVETLVRYLEIYQVITDGEGFKENLLFGHLLLRVMGIYVFCFHNTQAELLSRGITDCSFLSSIIGKTSLSDFNNGHRDIINLLVAIFTSESNINNDNFEPEYEENRAAWEGEIRGLFARGGFPPDRGERMKIVTNTIHTLKLFN